MIDEAHLRSDKDGSAKALHHTLGSGSNQAAPGNHSHDGGESTILDQLPHGKLAYVVCPTAITDCTAVVSVVYPLGATVIAGRSYRISAGVNGTQITTGGGRTSFSLTDSSGVGSVNIAYTNPAPVSQSIQGQGFYLYTATTSFDEAFYLQGIAAVGALHILVNSCWILVEDIGV